MSAPKTPKRIDRALNLAIAGTAGSSGCVTLVVVMSALLLGLWLDNQMDSKPLFTLGCIIGSVPISLFLMMRIILRSATSIQRRQYGSASGSQNTHDTNK